MFDEFLDYLWECPFLFAGDQFLEWEERKPDLVYYAFGDEIEDEEELAKQLNAAGVSEPRFRGIVCFLVEILWSSFFAAADDKGSMRYLKTVISSTDAHNLPPLNLFHISKFADEKGWGKPITEADWNLWRYCMKDTTEPVLSKTP